MKVGNDNDITIEMDNMNIQQGKLLSLEHMRKLQQDNLAWCYFNFYFMPSIVGRCRWVSSIQRLSKVQLLTTPSDEAFGLLVLNNCWDYWKWECDNKNATLLYKIENAPKFVFTSRGKERCTEGYGGWCPKGIALYNTLVDELTSSRKTLDKEFNKQPDGTFKTKMELLEHHFFQCAKIWDVTNVLHLNGKPKKMKLTQEEEDIVNAIQIFGWRDGNDN